MVEIKEVKNRKDLKNFIRFANKLYKDCPQYVPPLEFDELNTLSKEKNPAFEHCEAKYWLAYQNGEIVGRIAGIINRAANKKWGDKVRFGWFDFIEDIAVAKALLQTVEEWGKANGMQIIQGPLGFNDMDREGMLVEGFENEPTIANIYNYPYYIHFMEELGYIKAEDWLQYKIQLKAIPEKINRVSKMIAEKYNLRAMTFSKKSELKKYARPLFHTLNAAFSNLYGYSELTDKEIDSIVSSYFTFIDPKYVCIVLDEKDDVVAFGISMGSLSAAYKKANGKLFPFGFIHILRAINHPEKIDLYLNGVHPDWQKRGIHALYYTAMTQAYIDNHIPIAITNPQLESNINAVHIWSNYENELYCRRRCYEKNI